MHDLSTPAEHAAARTASAKPQAQRTEADVRAIDWIEGTERYYSGTAVHDPKFKASLT